MGKLIMSEEYLPTDLILNIISRLPAKYVARCRCLSKLWASLLTIGSPYFTELFLTQSKTRPRLLFAMLRENSEWCLYSCPQPQISSKNSQSSISVTAEFHMALPKSYRFADISMSPSVSGLMYFYDKPNLNNPTLCNPSTRSLFSLPQLTKTIRSYLGYDPINKQFKVLAISDQAPPPRHGYLGLPSSYQILKLGSGKLSWKSLNCPLHHYPFEPNICINGSLYYLVSLEFNIPNKIVCFDLNSEEFKIIDQPCQIEFLVNFKGKLGVLDSKWVQYNKRGTHLEVSLWVLEDIEKQECWSKHVYDILPRELRDIETKYYRIVGMTATGDIVLSFDYKMPSFYAYFLNLEENTLRKVEVEGFNYFNDHGFRGCVDYVEQLRALNWN